MNFSGDAGHNCIPDIGATGIKQEDILTKELVGLVANKLRSLGHTFTDCTPYNLKFKNVSGSLGYRCKIANASGSKLHLCIHFNAGGGHGVEAYCISAKDMAAKLCNEISALGFTNRGIKDGSGLFMVKNTSMPSILLEVAFVDSADDMNRYNADTVANSIVKALTGKIVTIPVPSSKKYRVITGVFIDKKMQKLEFWP
jgi:N-acetylmuramoyl-L-alanine amidase